MTNAQHPDDQIEQLTELEKDESPEMKEEIKKQQERGIYKIQVRQRQLANAWLTLHVPFILRLFITNALLKIGRDFADLENDFEYTKETAQFTACRYEEFVDVLPTMQEIEKLLTAMELIPENDKKFWLTENKTDRIKKIRKLSTAIKAMQQQ